MRATTSTTTSNKRNSSSSSVGLPDAGDHQQQRKSAKGHQCQQQQQQLVACGYGSASSSNKSSRTGGTRKSSAALPVSSSSSSSSSPFKSQNNALETLASLSSTSKAGAEEQRDQANYDSNKNNQDDDDEQGEEEGEGDEDEEEAKDEANTGESRVGKKELSIRDRIDQYFANQRQKEIYSNNCEDHRKQNHCEIEKRRRDKMNHYLMELASVIPSFNSQQSKFDKLTVLRMAVQHVKSLRSSLCSFSSFHLRPSFLSSGNLLKNLILQMASQESQDNLFMVVSCDRGKVLFVSQSSKDILNQDQHELVGQCLFDILHKDDVSKVKEQISYFNLMPKEMLVDSKTLQPIKNNQRQSFSQLQNQSNSTPQPGARRSFFCRMKSGRGSGSGDRAVTGAREPNLPSATSHQEQPGVNQANNFNSDNNNNNNKDTNRDGVTVSGGGGCDRTSAQQQNTPARSSSVNKGPGISGISQVPSSTRTCADTSQSTSSSSIDDNRVNNIDNINDSIDSNKIGGRNSQNNNNTSKSNDNKSTADRVSTGGNGSNVEQSSLSACDERPSPVVAVAANGAGSSGGEAREARSAGKTSTRTPTSSNAGSSSSSASTTDATTTTTNSSSVLSKKHWRYIVMHCTGYLKAITLRNDEFDDDDFDEDYQNSENNNSSDDEENDNHRTINCLVAVCRRSPMDRDLKPDRPLTFTCRYSMEGKFVFVDQRTTVALGYTPQQLLGTSHYAYCHKDSVNTFKECHRQSILKSEPVSSDIYQFKRANGQHLWLQTSLKSFRNPWTKFIDYIVANHTTAEGSEPHYNEECVPTKFNQDMTGGSSGGEASQSSSPASSSSLSLPSVDSKKSGSPSSSSIGSSYSMDSYASGGSIQALLNQIDRVKSGSIKHALEFHRRRRGPDGHLVPRSGSSGSSSSARKSNEDSGNYSDPQSCSSLSSQNSLSMSGVVDQYNNSGIIPGSGATQAATNSFVVDNRTTIIAATTTTITTNNNNQAANPTNNTSCLTNQNTSSTAPQYTTYKQSTNKMMNEFGSSAQPQLRSGLISYQLASQQIVGTNTKMSAGGSVGFEVDPENGGRVVRNHHTKQTGTRLSSGNKTTNGSSIKPHPHQTHRHYRHNHQYNNHHHHYSGRNQTKSGSSTSSDTGNETAPWSDSSGSVYSSSSSGGGGVTSHHNSGAGTHTPKDAQRSSSSEVCGGSRVVQNTQQQGSCQQMGNGNKLHQRQQQQSPYILQPMNIVQQQSGQSVVPMQTQNDAIGSTAGRQVVEETYLNELMQVNHSYMTHENVNQTCYDDGSVNNMNQAIQQQHANDIQANINMTMHQVQPSGDHPTNQNTMNVPMMWTNTTQETNNVYQMHNNNATAGQQRQICQSTNVVGDNESGGGGQMTLMNVDGIGNSNNQMIAQQIVNCQHCINHKCCASNNQQVMMPLSATTSNQQQNSNTDLNSINLTALAVDGDLDEDQLLEYLAGCDPEAQLYHIQNNAFPQYNI